LLRKQQKNFRGYFFAAACTSSRCADVCKLIVVCVHREVCCRHLKHQGEGTEGRTSVYRPCSRPSAGNQWRDIVTASVWDGADELGRLGVWAKSRWIFCRLFFYSCFKRV